MRSFPWLSRLLVPAFGTQPTPSADLYFRYALADLIGDDGGRPVKRLGSNLYAAGERYVLIRYAAPAELAVLEAARRERLLYVVDDDFTALIDDAGLPRGYRRRMAAFARDVLPQILAMDPLIVAPNQRLFAAFGSKAGLLIEPAHGPLNDNLGHFASLKPLRLVFAGTRSHVADLAAVATGIATFLDGHPQARLVTFLERHCPPPLDSHPQVENRAALDWPRYQQVLTTERFHLALAPFLPVAANEARSANKVNDHAAFGAAGLYGRIAPYRDRITHGADGLLVGDGPQDWLAALSELASQPHRMQAIARSGLALARKLGDPARQRRFWLQHLGL